jgi:hypothetical protein
MKEEASKIDQMKVFVYSYTKNIWRIFMCCIKHYQHLLIYLFI